MIDDVAERVTPSRRPRQEALCKSRIVAHTARLFRIFIVTKSNEIGAVGLICFALAIPLNYWFTDNVL